MATSLVPRLFEARLSQILEIMAKIDLSKRLLKMRVDDDLFS